MLNEQAKKAMLSIIKQSFENMGHEFCEEAADFSRASLNSYNSFFLENHVNYKVQKSQLGLTDTGKAYMIGLQDGIKDAIEELSKK